MKRSQLVIVLLFVLAVGLLLSAQPRTASANGSLKPALQATASGDDISIDPASTPAATPPLLVTAKPPTGGGGNINNNGTQVPIPPNPLVNPPPTLDDLIKAYPDLKPYLDKVKDMKVGDMDMAELYKYIVQIFKDKGASGVATFLKDSGILDKFNIPLSYLDLLTVYDSGGLDAVVKMAKQRKIISDKNELVGYLAIDDRANLGSVTDALKGLGVSVYTFLENTDEIQIGIPLDVLAQYQSPGALLGYLAQVGNVPHVVGFRPPTPVGISGKFLSPNLDGTVAAKTVGADKWQAAGITGKGVKVGVIDLGFGGIKAQLGSKLPENVTTNIPIDDMDSQEENHGTAVSMVVHGIAPEADMFMCYEDPTGDQGLLDCLKFMQDSGVKVINYSVGSELGPRDGTFGDSVLVEQFVQDTGILWVNAAGNEAINHSIFKYQDNGKGLHTFSPDDPKAVVLPFVAGEPSTRVILNWNGSWTGKEKDEYDFVVLDKDGNEVVRGDEPRKGKKNDFPAQVAVFDATPGDVYYLAFHKNHATKADILDVFVGNALFADWAQVPAYSVIMPADADSVLTVGATGLTKDALEIYSSQGPTTDGRLKPDLTAPTGEKLPGYDDEYGFAGTSGAAPVITGAAALVWQKFPDMTQAEVKAFLTSHVKPLGKKSPNPQFGSGRLSLGDPGKVNNEDPSANTDPEATPEPDQVEPTATPEESANPDAPIATITNTDAKFNQTFKGKKGIKVSVSFDVDNFKGRKGVVAILFYDKSTGKQVPTDDQNYTVIDGLGTGQAFTSKTKSSSFDSVPLFIPNSAFSKLGSGTKPLFYIILVADITDENNVQIIGASDKIDITFKK